MAQSEAQKVASKRYLESDKGKLADRNAHAKYRKSEKGKLVSVLSSRKYRAKLKLLELANEAL